MFETPKIIKRNHLKDAPALARYCGIEGCNRLATVYVKEHDISRCAACYQRDLDRAGKSANQLSAVTF
jgi:hypothetical protein